MELDDGEFLEFVLVVVEVFVVFKFESFKIIKFVVKKFNGVRLIDCSNGGVLEVFNGE